MTAHRPPITPETARRLTIDTEPWLSCDDCFDLIDQYLEALMSGTRTPMLPMSVHLVGCTACYDEALSLLTLIAVEDELDPTLAISRLNAALPTAGSFSSPLIDYPADPGA